MTQSKECQSGAGGKLTAQPCWSASHLASCIPSTLARRPPSALLPPMLLSPSPLSAICSRLPRLSVIYSTPHPVQQKPGAISPANRSLFLSLVMVVHVVTGGIKANESNRAQVRACLKATHKAAGQRGRGSVCSGVWTRSQNDRYERVGRRCRPVS